ncbi:MAG: ABC transporter substrate-binding protein [Deltaproteobacteria bacterium]|nr:ABC transporter substrate-binding protein [Deltaproteobacteria bacterium]
MRKRYGKITALLLTFAVLVLLPAGPGGAATQKPQEYLKARINDVLQALNDPDFLKDRKRLEEKLTKLFHEQFDIAYTTKLSLGRHWRKLTPKQRQEFVPLFADLLQSTYIGRLDDYNQQKIEIKYGKELIRGKKALVKTTIITEGKEIPVDYKLINRDGKWMVYDVIVEQVSLVRNYRSQFDDFLQKKSVEDLMAELRRKIAENLANRKKKQEARQ